MCCGVASHRSFFCRCRRHCCIYCVDAAVAHLFDTPCLCPLPLSPATGLYPAVWHVPVDPEAVQRAQQAQHAALLPKAGGFGREVVGRQVAHFWRLENAWFGGILKDYRPGCVPCCASACPADANCWPALCCSKRTERRYALTACAPCPSHCCRPYPAATPRCTPFSTMMGIRGWSTLHWLGRFCLCGC